jgi:hypothetical protein
MALAWLQLQQTNAVKKTHSTDHVRGAQGTNSLALSQTGHPSPCKPAAAAQRKPRHEMHADPSHMQRWRKKPGVLCCQACILPDTHQGELPEPLLLVPAHPQVPSGSQKNTRIHLTTSSYSTAAAQPSAGRLAPCALQRRVSVHPSASPQHVCYAKLAPANAVLCRGLKLESVRTLEKVWLFSCQRRTGR